VETPNEGRYIKQSRGKSEHGYKSSAYGKREKNVRRFIRRQSHLMEMSMKDGYSYYFLFDFSFRKFFWHYRM
jgi:hypothetical protein